MPDPQEAAAKAAELTVSFYHILSEHDRNVLNTHITTALTEARSAALKEAAEMVLKVVEKPVGYEDAIASAVKQLEDAGAEWPHNGIFQQTVELIIDEASGKVCDEFRTIVASLERMAGAAEQVDTEGAGNA